MRTRRRSSREAGQSQRRGGGKKDWPARGPPESQGPRQPAPGEGTSPFGRLGRRGVLGALAAYGVAAAGALQLADIVVHNLDLPPWTVRAMIWVAVIGFVATGVISWFYDLTRRGFVRTQAPLERAGPPASTPR